MNAWIGIQLLESFYLLTETSLISLGRIAPKFTVSLDNDSKSIHFCFRRLETKPFFDYDVPLLGEKGDYFWILLQ
jgi:hypothetical protein